MDVYITHTIEERHLPYLISPLIFNLEINGSLRGNEEPICSRERHPLKSEGRKLLCDSLEKKG